MAKRHAMTPRRRAALRKAQLASARKRRKSGGPQRKARRAATRRRVGRAAVKGATAVGYAAVVSTALIGPSNTYRLGKGAAKAPVHAARAGKSFGKGFARGYSQSRARQNRAAYNTRHMGGTTIHRASVPALPGGGHRTSKRRVRGY